VLMPSMLTLEVSATGGTLFFRVVTEDGTFNQDSSYDGACAQSVQLFEQVERDTHRRG
jgi:hypothetical protein